jgi:hypothetical protein
MLLVLFTWHAFSTLWCFQMSDGQPCSELETKGGILSQVVLTDSFKEAIQDHDDQDWRADAHVQ